MKEGITAYIIENNLKIRKVTVAHITGNMALVKFDEGGGIRVRLDRIAKKLLEDIWVLRGLYTINIMDN